MISVVCVWVRGHVPYGVEYVERLARSVRRRLREEHEIACLTDRPRALPRGVRAVEVKPTPGVFAWWTKIKLFDPDLPLLGERRLYVDLDSLLVGDLGKVAHYDSAFALVPHAGEFNGKDGLAVVKRYNSSVVVWDALSPLPGELYERWSPDVAHRLWGDQDYIAEQLPDLDTMPIEWFPRLSALRATAPGPEAVVVLAKKPKPHVAAAQWPWAARAWSGR